MTISHLFLYGMVFEILIIKIIRIIMNTKEFRSIFPIINSSNLTDSLLDTMFNQKYEEKRYESSSNDLGWTLKLPLPGIEKSDISIETPNQRSITVSVLNGNTWVKKSNRSFSLPDSADTDNISADFKNGVLVIDIPAVKSDVSKKIKIK
jgi:HSP20 family protein